MEGKPILQKRIVSLMPLDCSCNKMLVQPWLVWSGMPQTYTKAWEMQVLAKARELEKAYVANQQTLQNEGG